MATKKKRTYQKKTPEQRQEQIDKLRETQEAAIMSLLDSGEWARYLQALRSFHTYSFANTMLILWQKPDATRVAGFKTWQKLGRKVVSGPGSGIQIWGKPYRPTYWVEKSKLKPDTEILDSDGSKVKIRAEFTRCSPVYVFDVSQTEGDPLPEVVHTLTDGDHSHRAILDKVTDWLTSEGWTVRTDADLGSAHGATNFTTRQVALNGNDGIAQQAKTILHEAAHAILHGDDTYVKVSEYHNSSLHRGAAEVQAEAVAYVMAGILGLDTAQYSTGYVTSWAARAAQSDDSDAVRDVLKSAGMAVAHATKIMCAALVDVDTEEAATEPALAS